jgi:hypothetical protein
MKNPSPSPGAFEALALQLEQLARKPLQPKRRELRRLAAQFRLRAEWQEKA